MVVGDICSPNALFALTHILIVLSVLLFIFTYAGASRRGTDSSLCANDGHSLRRTIVHHGPAGHLLAQRPLPLAHRCPLHLPCRLPPKGKFNSSMQLGHK